MQGHGPVETQGELERVAELSELERWVYPEDRGCAAERVGSSSSLPPTKVLLVTP